MSLYVIPSLRCLNCNIPNMKSKNKNNIKKYISKKKLKKTTTKKNIQHKPKYVNNFAPILVQSLVIFNLLNNRAFPL